MFNYKRLTFIFLFLTIILLATDTSTERQIRKNLLSFFDVVVEESGQVSDSAPTTFVETMEDIRMSTYEFLSQSGKYLEQKASLNKGIVSLGLTLSTYIVYLFKFVSSFVIIFYPFVIFILYMFFTSRFFGRRDDFGYDNF